MIAFTKEGSRASFWALLTSWSQYLWYKTKHSKQHVPQRGNGGGAEWETSLHYRALCGCAIDAGYLLTGLLKDERYRLWRSRETGLEGKVPDSGNKFLPRFAGLTGHEQFRRADSLFQGPHLQGQSSASRAVAAGSLHVHRCTGNMGSPSLQNGLSPGSTWGDEHTVPGEEPQENPEEGKASPKPLAPRENSHSPSPPPCCLCSPLQLFSKVLGAIFWKHWVHVICF